MLDDFFENVGNITQHNSNDARIYHIEVGDLDDTGVNMIMEYCYAVTDSKRIKDVAFSPMRHGVRVVYPDVD